MHITPLLPQEQIDALPAILLPGTRNNPLPEYTSLQQWMLPYADMIHTGWWVIMALTLAFMCARYIVVPLVTRAGMAAPAPSAPARVTGVAAAYKRLFSLHEVEQDVLVRWFAGAVLIGFLATFRMWQTAIGSTVQAIEFNRVSCWPFFQTCGDWLFLEHFPFGYSQMIVFMALFALILLAAHALIVKRYILAHAAIALLFFAKLYFLLLNFAIAGNYDYYHTIFTFIFLFLPHKRFFASLSVVMLYVLSTVAKIHPSWTFGLYFTPLKPGMPIFSDSIIPLMTNLVIFMELVMAWFLFSRRRWLQRGVFAFFCLFHIYSGTLVGFHYPTIVMPALLVCFGTLYRPFTHIPLDARSIGGWALMAVLWGLQSIPLIIPGDAKLTLEGNFYGLYMFDANHQCSILMRDAQGRVLEERASSRARFRCDPFPHMARGQRAYCRHAQAPKIQFYMIHSINGGPFYEIVNEPDLCSLTYAPFGRNRWIRDATTARIVGRPAQNFYE